MVRQLQLSVKFYVVGFRGFIFPFFRGAFTATFLAGEAFLTAADLVVFFAGIV
jgi:uncharacterized protein (DUF2235 family)